MKWIRLSCYALAVLLTGFYVPYWITQLVYTTPEHGQTWLENFESPRFSKTINIALPLASVSFIFDLAIYSLPIVGVSRLHMSRQQKFEILIVFMTGAM
jgi:hypothetical protein